jgi:hypothetical protein
MRPTEYITTTEKIDDRNDMSYVIANHAPGSDWEFHQCVPVSRDGYLPNGAYYFIWKR